MEVERQARDASREAATATTKDIPSSCSCRGYNPDSMATFIAHVAPRQTAISEGDGLCATMTVVTCVRSLLLNVLLPPAQVLGTRKARTGRSTCPWRVGNTSFHFCVTFLETFTIMTRLTSDGTPTSR